MAIKQPLLPTARDCHAEVAVVETDHRRREGIRISCQLRENRSARASRIRDHHNSTGRNGRAARLKRTATSGSPAMSAIAAIPKEACEMAYSHAVGATMTSEVREPTRNPRIGSRYL